MSEKCTLKPCSVCGSAGEFCDIDSNVGVIWSASCTNEDCDRCFNEGWFKSKENAAANWHRATPTVRQIAAIQAMRGMLANPDMIGHSTDFAADAVKHADALIAELSK